jgi:hypothetical protein
MFISKKRWQALVNRIACLEGLVQSQQSTIDVSELKQSFGKLISTIGKSTVEIAGDSITIRVK